jgi:hypothetical protein
MGNVLWLGRGHQRGVGRVQGLERGYGRPRTSHQCKLKTKAAPASGIVEHVNTITQHTRAIAEAAAAELALTDGASAQAQMTENIMHNIADLIYKRILKGKVPPQE